MHEYTNFLYTQVDFHSASNTCTWSLKYLHIRITSIIYNLLPLVLEWHVVVQWIFYNFVYNCIMLNIFAKFLALKVLTGIYGYNSLNSEVLQKCGKTMTFIRIIMQYREIIIIIYLDNINYNFYKI